MKYMKIGIDTFGCNHSQSGQGAYILNFLSNLPSDTQYQFELFGYEIDRFVYTGENGLKFISIDIKDSPKAIKRWHKRKSRKFFKINGYDAVLFPAAEKILPKKLKTKGIAVFSSVLSKVLINSSKRDRRLLHKGLKQVSHIIAGSEYIKNDLIKNGVAQEKISVIYNGIDHKVFFPSIQLDADYIDVKPFSIKRPYFIYGSRLLDSDKKHEALIQAFTLFKKRTNYPHRLVLSGSEGDYSSIVHQAVYNSEFASDIFITGFFPHSSFSQLYAGATACIFPAVNEGVGLPIIEAMACGIPVLCSDSGALKEIGGDVPLFFDSDNIDQIADFMQKIVEDSDLYKECTKKGLEWASRFNWEDTVSQTLKIVDLLCN